jgi:glucose-6-phosphate 1-dehydrogenase
MTSQIIPVEPFDCIVFGGTGDLAERKLIPALYQRQVAGQLSEPTRILGASRAQMSTDEYRRIIVEKPLGRDLASAKKLNDIIGNDFAEHQVFRIDHYLGKETVQNLMALRFANALYEPLWNSAHIDHVQITVAETVGLEGRVGYYDTAARCATWCRTISCSCSASSPWSRRPRWTPTRCATRS